MRDKAFNIAQNPKYDGYQKGIAPVFDNFLNKKTSNTHTHTHTHTHRESERERERRKKVY